MKFNSHSLSREREAERPIRGQSFRTTRLSGNSSCATTPDKFGVVNLITQHNEATDQKLSSDRHFRFWPITTMYQSLIELFQFRIAARGCLPCFVKQKAQQFRASFTDTAHPPTFGRLIFNAIKPYVSGDATRSAEARNRLQRVAQGQGRQQ